MASGDTLLILTPHMAEFPSSSNGQLDERNNHPVIDLALTEMVYFPLVIPQHYAGGGITVKLHYAMSSAVANDVRLDTFFERIGDGQQDIDSDGFDVTGVDGTDTTVPGTSGHVDILSNAHTDGARIDSLAVGENGRLKVLRSAVVGTDAAGDLELKAIELQET